MERKKLVYGRRAILTATLMAALLAVLLLLGGQATARAASPAGATTQAGSSENNLGPLPSIPDRCARCHGPPTPDHDGPACGPCHSASSFTPRSATGSEISLALLGRDRAAVAQPARAKWAGTQGGDLAVQRTADRCGECHAPPTRYHYGPACGQCHTADDFMPADVTRLAHPVRLVGGHAGLECATCHLPTRKVTAACNTCHRAPTGHFTGTCSSCHGPEGWAESAAAGMAGPAAPHLLSAADDCLACHAAGGPNWPAPAGHKEYTLGQCRLCHLSAGKTSVTIQHQKVAGLLVGTHTRLDCVQCHTNGQFKGTAQQCVTCHQAEDRHAGQFGQDCGRCHTPNGWAQLTFDHSQTAFALVGAHSRAACSSCHAGGRFDGTPQKCVACHQADDRHDGQFGQACGRCHTANGWEGATFDHSQTDFALIGAHAGTPCTSCHVNGQFDGTPQQCVACHQVDDRHDGQFGQDCGRCHTPNGWEGATFDHNQTGFPLTGAHVGTPCTSCHVNGQFDGTPRECVACHGEPSYHAGRLGIDCASCHQTAGWLPASYDRPHTFPRRHKGASDCRTCHPSTLGDYTCYACHDRGEVAEKHIDHGIPDYSNCVACHPDGDDG